MLPGGFSGVHAGGILRTVRIATFGHDRELRRLQLGRHPGKEILIGIRTRQQKANSARVTRDHGANLQQLQTDRTDVGIGQFGPLKAQASKRFQQRVGETG